MTLSTNGAQKRKSCGETNTKVRPGGQPKADGEKRPATDTENPEMQERQI